MYARATRADIVAAIAPSTRAFVIHAATGIAGYATREVVAIEQHMLACEAQGRDRFAP